MTAVGTETRARIVTSGLSFLDMPQSGMKWGGF